jgi:hypothetical protein
MRNAGNSGLKLETKDCPGLIGHQLVMKSEINCELGGGLSQHGDET